MSRKSTARGLARGDEDDDACKAPVLRCATAPHTAHAGSGGGGAGDATGSGTACHGRACAAPPHRRTSPAHDALGSHLADGTSLIAKATDGYIAYARLSVTERLSGTHSLTESNGIHTDHANALIREKSEARKSAGDLVPYLRSRSLRLGPDPAFLKLKPLERMLQRLPRAPGPRKQAMLIQ